MNEATELILDKVCKLAEYDAEFKSALRNRFAKKYNTSTQINVRLDEIYEYCIEVVSKKQANDFYKDFPLKDILPKLISDYIRMESFRRKDNFEDFSLALFQQIECITNYICKDSDFSNTVNKLWGYPAFIKYNSYTISDRLEKYSNGSKVPIIAYFIFSQRYKNNKSLAVDKSSKALVEQSIYDKIKIIIYFLGFKGMPKLNDYNKYEEITSLMKYIYQCRNTNHRETIQYEWQQDILNRILPLKSLYYFKFLGALAQFVEFIKGGISFKQILKDYADSVEKLVVPEPPK